jgi:hypothetical protein
VSPCTVSSSKYTVFDLVTSLCSTFAKVKKFGSNETAVPTDQEYVRLVEEAKTLSAATNINSRKSVQQTTRFVCSSKVCYIRHPTTSGVASSIVHAERGGWTNARSPATWPYASCIFYGARFSQMEEERCRVLVSLASTCGGNSRLNKKRFVDTKIKVSTCRVASEDPGQMGLTSSSSKTSRVKQCLNLAEFFLPHNTKASSEYLRFSVQLSSSMQTSFSAEVFYHQHVQT